MAKRDQLGAQLGIVVDAAIEGDGQPERGVDEGLRGRLREVDDLEPPVAEPGRPAQNHARAVRPARRHGVAHSFNSCRRRGHTAHAKFSANSAHGFFGSVIASGSRPEVAHLYAGASL